MNEDGQLGLLDETEDVATPTRKLEPYATILVHFATPEDRAAFQARIGQRIAWTGRGQGQLWFPKAPVATFGDDR